MSALSWGRAASFARRDLHRSLRGLRLLFLCIFLGVATLAAIGGLSSAITSEIADRGRVLLGGDVQVSTTQRQATPQELAAMRSEGTLSETIRMRAMARGGGEGALLTELKGVDAAYPLFGTLTVRGKAVRAPGPGNVYIAPELGERLGVRPGDRLRFGEADQAEELAHPLEEPAGARRGAVAVAQLPAGRGELRLEVVDDRFGLGIGRQLQPVFGGQHAARLDQAGAL